MKRNFKLLALLLAILMLTACGTAPAEETVDGQTTPEQNSELSDTIPTESSSEVLQEPEAGKTYEDYLCALTLYALSMEYPDFQLQESYALSEIAPANKNYSEGAYVMFESMGENLCVHVYPLAEERTEAFTRDIYTAELGFVAFDILEEAPNTENLLPLDAAIFSQLLSELSSVSIYSH